MWIMIMHVKCRWLAYDSNMFINIACIVLYCTVLYCMYCMWIHIIDHDNINKHVGVGGYYSEICGRVKHAHARVNQS
jgi:hypothetical protein